MFFERDCIWKKETKAFDIGFSDMLHKKKSISPILRLVYNKTNKKTIRTLQKKRQIDE